MKRNIINFTILFCIAALVASALSEVQAAGKIQIRKAPGADAKIQAPKGKGFSSEWSFPDEQKAPVQMTFTATPIRAGKVAPENPKEVQTEKSQVPHYVGEVALNNDELFINIRKVGNRYQVMLPDPAGFCSKVPTTRDYLNGTDSSQQVDSSLQIVHTPEEVFLNGQANRIVVWNGKTGDLGQQLLICSDRPRSTTGQKEAVLSVMPLPGEPIEIRRVSDNFTALKKKLEEITYGGKNDVGHEHSEWNGRIASYCAQAVEVDNLEDFLYQAENMVSNLYGDKARLQWQPSQLSAIQLLLGSYKWYAFDVSMLREWVTVTEPIAYQTKSDVVWVPLLEGRIGGANSKSLTTVIVITPNKVKLNEKCGLTNKDVDYLNDKPVEFCVEELQCLSPDAAAFCKKHKIEKVFVQALYIRNYINKYPGDLIMENAPVEKAPEKNVQAPANPSVKDKPAGESKPDSKNSPRNGRRGNRNG